MVCDRDFGLSHSARSFAASKQSAVRGQFRQFNLIGAQLMGLHENLDEFYNLPVKDFEASGDIRDFLKVAPRVRCRRGSSSTLADHIGALLAEPGASEIRALVLGMWAENGETIDATPTKAIELLVSNKHKLPNLEALFVGDISSEENEISKIQNGDMSPIWPAFPNLRNFRVRGSKGLRLGDINHSSLKTLIIETRGLPAAVAREAIEANAPIEHLELWFGAKKYGLTTTISDLDDLLEGKLLPNLKTLALYHCDFDEIFERLVNAVSVRRIEEIHFCWPPFVSPAPLLQISRNESYLRSRAHEVYRKGNGS